MNDSIDLSELVLRPETPQDEAFCFELYASTRKEELDAWGWPAEMRRAFLQMQFKACQGHRAVFPNADFRIVDLAGRNLGRIIVDRAATEFRLVDIALLPEYRNAGVGTALLRALLAEAASAGKPLRLTVRKGNRAARLYSRLGFVKTGETEMDDEMERKADSRNACAQA
jgi:ribosomal protein S18 acetylase RimI-like enzyme